MACSASPVSYAAPISFLNNNSLFFIPSQNVELEGKCITLLGGMIACRTETHLSFESEECKILVSLFCFHLSLEVKLNPNDGIIIEGFLCIYDFRGY